MTRGAIRHVKPCHCMQERTAGAKEPGEEKSHPVATSSAQHSCPRPVTRMPGMGHFQSNNNWENT